VTVLEVDKVMVVTVEKEGGSVAMGAPPSPISTTISSWTTTISYSTGSKIVVGVGARVVDVDVAILGISTLTTGRTVGIGLLGTDSDDRTVGKMLGNEIEIPPVAEGAELWQYGVA
jgi:hypothetical protein